MKIEINNGTYIRDEEAAELMTGTEDEYVAALAQKLVVRQARQQAKARKAQEQELQRRIAKNRLFNGEN